MWRYQEMTPIKPYKTNRNQFFGFSSNFETKITSILADIVNFLNYNFWDVAPVRY